MPTNDALISIHTFNYRYEAEMARGLLEANGIYATVFSDDAGNQEVSLQFVRGAMLMVKPEDEPRAKALLKLH
jgi:hypothetical protein